MPLHEPNMKCPLLWEIGRGIHGNGHGNDVVLIGYGIASTANELRIR